MTRSALSSNGGARFLRRRGTAVLVVAVWLVTARVAGAGDVPASSPAAMVGNSPTSRPDQGTAPTTAKAYLELALQEAARISNGNDQMGTYQSIIIAQLAADDIAAAQQMLPRIADNNLRGFLEMQIAVALARQGNAAEARALNERIALEGARQAGEELIAQAEVLDLAKKGKGEEALQMAQDQEEPRARMTALCGLVREFALAKDAPRARKALELAIKATSYLEPSDRGLAPMQIAQAEASVGDVQGARARISAMAEPSRDTAYCLIAAIQARNGDVEGATQMMESVGKSGGNRAWGYGLCASVSPTPAQGDKANARRLVQQAMAAYSADPDTQGRSRTVISIVQAQAKLGDTAGAMALARETSDAQVRAGAYQNIALYQAWHEGPAAAYAWAQELQSPMERALAWAGIAMGLAQRQMRAEGGAGK